LGAPIKGIEARTIHQFARCASRLTSIKRDLTRITDRNSHGLGEIAKYDVIPAANINVAEHKLCMWFICCLVKVHDVHAGSGHIINIEELPIRHTSPPDCD